MKPADVNSSTYFDFGLENNKEDPKFEVGDHIRIWNHRNIFGQGYTPNWFEEIFLIKKVKSSVQWTYVNSDFNDEEIVERLTRKIAKKKKIKSQGFRVEIIIKRKGDKLYVK